MINVRCPNCGFEGKAQRSNPYEVPVLVFLIAAFVSFYAIPISFVAFIVAAIAGVAFILSFLLMITTQGNVPCPRCKFPHTIPVDESILTHNTKEGYHHV